MEEDKEKSTSSLDIDEDMKNYDGAIMIKPMVSSDSTPVTPPEISTPPEPITSTDEKEVKISCISNQVDSEEKQ